MLRRPAGILATTPWIGGLPDEGGSHTDVTFMLLERAGALATAVSGCRTASYVQMPVVADGPWRLAFASEAT